MLHYFLKSARFGAMLLALGAATLAAPAAAQQQGAEQPQEVVKEKIGDWQIVCQEVNSQELCFIEQFVVNKDGEAMVRMRVRKLPEPQVVGAQTILAEAQFLVPLNMFLPAEMGLRIDENQTLRTPYTRCVTIGCFAQPPLSETLVRQLKEGSKAAVIMATGPGQPSLNASMSLTGFTAAFDKL